MYIVGGKMLNKQIVIKLIKLAEYKKILGENNKSVPLYMDPDVISCYEDLEILKVSKGEKLIAIYAYPLFNNGEMICVERQYRFLPYTSPVFFENLDSLHCKKICYMIFKYIFDKYKAVYLPLSPNFKCVSAIQSLGGFVEIRHTHIATQGLTLNSLNSKLRNHINHANKMVNIVINKDINLFRFDIAIVGNKNEQEKRKKHAINIINRGKGVIITAMQDNISVAGAILVYDSEYVYLLHSWQMADTPRGVIPLIIFRAIEWSYNNLPIKYFDFEGSVIQNVDDFFSTFNVEVVTYPYIHYASEKNDFWKLISKSINVNGRKYGGEKND